MINILSVSCSLGFAPCLQQGLKEFLALGSAPPQVVRHAGSGLIIRCEDELAIRYQGRECRLGPHDARHYLATIGMRAAAYDIAQMSNEVVISNFSGAIVLSHPQSELWLELPVAAALVQMYKLGADTHSDLPAWLKASLGGGQLLLSDQRSGRWVLLGPDHVTELERRLTLLPGPKPRSNPRPPRIEIKGLSVHLQSALKLAETLSSFAETGAVDVYDEITPIYSLSISQCTEGIALRDSTDRITITKREARKWLALISAELERLNARQFERGRIRTVIVDGDVGQWVLQWGDEVFVSNEERYNGNLRIDRIGEVRTLLAVETSGCVVLEDSEAEVLRA